MKNLIIVFVSCFMLLACSDVVDLSQHQNTTTNNNALKNADAVNALDIGPVNPYVWTRLQVPLMSNYPFNNANGRNTIVQINDDVYCLMGDLYEIVYKLNNSTKRWERFSDPFTMYLQLAVGYNYLFSYQSKFYVGLRLGGGDDAGGEDESWVGSLDPITGARGETRFPGTPVSDPACFVVGSKGYIIGGYNPRTKNVVNQFWEYDFISNQWTNKGALPGGARAGASAYVLNNKVYFGLGYDIMTLNGQRITRYKNDWYQMDPANSGGYAIIKTDFPGTSKKYPRGFTINDKFYLAWGQTTDFWEYNPANNKWAQKDNLPVTASDQNNICVFALNNTGYHVKGCLSQFWRYSNSSIVPVP